MSDQPTTPLPAAHARADRPPAWSDPATRTSARRSLWLALLLLLIGLAAVGGCVALFLTGTLGEAWGLWVLVVAGGLAGGALAAGITMLVLWVRLRGFLRRGPWSPGVLTLGERRDAQLVHGRSMGSVRLDVRAGSLGDPGDELTVDVRSDGDHIVLTVPPSRRMIRGTSIPDAPRED